jgi:hypothetical protein
MFRQFIILIASITVISCNNSGEKIYPFPSDSPAVAVTDSTAIREPKSARLGYTYFNTIKRNEVKNIRAYLSIRFPESKVRDTLRQIERRQEISRTDDDSSIINTLDIRLYDYVEINLLDPAKDYTITPVNHTIDKQKVDTLRGNSWGWTVLTKTDKKITTLILKVTAYMPDSTLELDNRSIPIRIKLEKNIIRKLWTVLLDDPKNFLWVILVPLAAFFGKRYFDRKKAAKKD